MDPATNSNLAGGLGPGSSIRACIRSTCHANEELLGPDGVGAEAYRNVEERDVLEDNQLLPAAGHSLLAVRGGGGGRASGPY